MAARRAEPGEAYEVLKDPEKRKFFSPANYGIHITTAPAIERYATGALIDVGCGDMPYKDLILSKVQKYDTFDFERRAEGVTFVGDVQHMDMIAAESYDSAICLEVLEHVPDPFKGFDELARILKTGGVLILSVPHLSRLHEEPHDYYRYTKYALRTILETRGFEILELKERGGLFSFLGHQVSTAVVCLTWHIPVIKHVMFFLNKWLCVYPSRALDALLSGGGMFALGYTVVARKK
jgi:SAM-dependent methyltransferase